MSIFDRFLSKKDSILPAAVNEILNQDMIITDLGHDALVDQILEAVQKIDPFVLVEEPEHQVSHLRELQTDTGAQKYVTIIPISGPLVKKSTWLTSYLGLASYAGIALAIQAAVKDPRCIGILLDIDSPGGQASGLFDLVDLIYSFRDAKTIIGLSNASAYSAAYAIASATSELYTVRDGGVGSIGVIMRHFDYSEMFKKAGIAVTAVFAGKRKDDFSPYKPLSKEALKRAQDMVNETYQQFVDTVSRNLGIKVEKIKATEAGIFFGEDAVKKNLVKGVMSYEDTIDRTIKQAGGIRASGQNRSSQTEMRHLVFSGLETSSQDFGGFNTYRRLYFASINEADSKCTIKEAPLVMKEWIASKSLLGDPKGNDWSNINNLPVVNPNTGRLNKEALEAVLKNSETSEAIKNTASQLLTKFTKILISKQDSMLQKVLNKFFKKGDNKNMDKAQMIELLIKDEKYPFGKDDQSALEGMSETMLKWLVDVKKDQIDEDELRAEIKRELEAPGADKIKLLDDQVITLKTTIETLTTEVNDTKIIAQNEADERKKMEFTQLIKDKNIPGDIEKLVKTMLALSKGDAEVFETYKESLEVAGQSLTAAGIFSELGSGSGSDSGESAYVKLQSLKVEAMKSDSNLSETQAWKAVVRGNQKLYKEYMAESKRKEVK